MSWKDLKGLYEEEEEPRKLSINKPDNKPTMRTEEIPSYIDGWEKVFPVGEVQKNPPYWRKNGLIIPDEEWLAKHHKPEDENSEVP